LPGASNHTYQLSGVQVLGPSAIDYLVTDVEYNGGDCAEPGYSSPPLPSKHADLPPSLGTLQLPTVASAATEHSAATWFWLGCRCTRRVVCHHHPRQAHAAVSTRAPRLASLRLGRRCGLKKRPLASDLPSCCTNIIRPGIGLAQLLYEHHSPWHRTCPAVVRTSFALESDLPSCCTNIIRPGIGLAQLLYEPTNLTRWHRTRPAAV
jgi:hypothetical protein